MASFTFDPSKLREWRREQGLRPEQVAAPAVVSRQWYMSVEGGKHPNPSINLILRICAALGHDPRELIVPVGDDEAAAA
jgi:transcriptional regulator with XRE-family HTH domain